MPEYQLRPDPPEPPKPPKKESAFDRMHREAMEALHRAAPEQKAAKEEQDRLMAELQNFRTGGVTIDWSLVDSDHQPIPEPPPPEPVDAQKELLRALRRYVSTFTFGTNPEAYDSLKRHLTQAEEYLVEPDRPRDVALAITKHRIIVGPAGLVDHTSRFQAAVNRSAEAGSPHKLLWVHDNTITAVSRLTILIDKMYYAMDEAREEAAKSTTGTAPTDSPPY